MTFEIWRDPPGERAPGDLVDQLTDYGREMMLRELLQAIEKDDEFVRDADVSLIARVVASYRRTAFVRQDPQYPETLRRIREVAGKTPEELGERVYSSEELRQLLRLDGD